MRILHGLLGGLMLLMTLAMASVFHKHLLHPLEAHHVSNLVTDGAMMLLFGYFAWTEGRRAFGRPADGNGDFSSGGQDRPV